MQESFGRSRCKFYTSDLVRFIRKRSQGETGRRRKRRLGDQKKGRGDVGDSPRISHIGSQSASIQPRTSRSQFADSNASSISALLEALLELLDGHLPALRHAPEALLAADLPDVLLPVVHLGSHFRFGGQIRNSGDLISNFQISRYHFLNSKK